MKTLYKTIQESIKLFYAVIFISAMGVMMVAALPEISLAMGMEYCGSLCSVDSDTAYVRFKITNNHYPSTLTITKMHIYANLDDSDSKCYQDGSECKKDTMLKKIEFDDELNFDGAAVAYNYTNHSNKSYCICRGKYTTYHEGHLFTLDTPYPFGSSWIYCRVQIDRKGDNVAKGTWYITYYYTIEGDATERSTQIDSFYIDKTN